MSRDESPIVRPVPEDEEYTYMHRAFFQAFLTHSVMTTDELKPVLAHVMSAHNPDRPCSEGDITQPLIISTIQTINAKIEHYDFEIRSIKDQQSKLTVYALVNKTSDSLTQLATRFSPSEIAYIRRLLDHMFDTNNTHTREIMALKHTEASQLARPSRRTRTSQFPPTAEHSDAEPSQPADTGISIQEADDVLSALQNEGFLQKSRTQYYSLAPRALMELRAYLKQTYNDEADGDGDDEAVVRIRDCEGCREIVTFGIRCNRRECGVRWHDACANSYYRGRRRGERKCPGCGAVCEGDVYVGERADRVGRGRGREEEDDDDEDGEGEE